MQIGIVQTSSGRIMNVILAAEELGDLLHPNSFHVR